MSKYIDTDLLRKEIEFAKSVYSHPNRVVHGVADAFRQDGRVAMCDDILKKIDSLQQEQPITEEDLVEKRKQECGYRKLSSGNYQCERYEGVFGPCDGQCSWVVDYPKLKGKKELRPGECGEDDETDSILTEVASIILDDANRAYSIEEEEHLKHLASKLQSLRPQHH